MILQLLQQMEKSPTCTFRKKELLELSEDGFERLMGLGLLVYCQRDADCETYPCRLPCIRGCSMEVVNMGGKPYAICPTDTEVDPMLLSEDDLAEYRLVVERVVGAIRGTDDYVGDSYALGARMHFIGGRLVQGVSIAFVLALFPDVRTAEAELLSLPNRLAVQYREIIVVTPALDLTTEPIYAKLRTAGIVPVRLPEGFGRETFKVEYRGAGKREVPAGITLDKHESAKRLAEAYGLDVKRVRSELSKHYLGPGGREANNPLRSELRLLVEGAGARETQYLWCTELVRPVLEKLAAKHMKKH